MIEQLLDGRYQITQVLAQGGFGQTYLATDKRRPGQPICVVKRLRPVANPEILPTVQRLFNTEAETLENLGQHDQIPRLLAYFEENQEFYLVQEFIPGHPLDQEILPKQPMAIAQVIRLLTDILEVLVFVHGQGVIHRDIKPANIIRRESDQKLVLIDFGTVKEIRTVTDLDESNVTVAVGTPAYMPIEQFHGHPQLNSDIYALGIVGIQSLSGLSIDAIRTLITPSRPQTPPVHWSDSLFGGEEASEQMLQLTAVLDKMVHLDYRERYQTAVSVLNDLQAVNSDPSIPIIPAKIAPSFISPLSSELPSQIPNLSPSSPTPVITTKHRQFPSGLLIGSGVAIALITGAHHLSSLLPRLPSPSPLPSTQSVSPQAANFTLARTLSGHTDLVWSVALSQDEKALVSGSQDDTIKVWNPTTGQLNRTIEAQADGVRSVSVSADGKTLAGGNGDKTIKVWDLQTGNLRHILAGHTGSVWSVALSRDGKTLVSGSQDNTIKVWNVETGQLVRTLMGHSGIVYSVIFSPYEKTVVSGSADKTLKVWDLQTGKLLRTLEGHGDVVRSLAISPNGQTLASASWDRTIKVWNLQTGELLRTLEGHQDRVVSVAFSADGTLASTSLDKTVKTWNPQTGITLQTLTDHTDWGLSVATNANRSLLVSSSKDRTIKLWQR
jgi:WD40 repeat protein/predicted Ser/Thr protein kinase